MKKIVLITVLSVFVGCKASKETTVKEVNITTFGNSITAKDLKKHLFTYASDEFEGRLTGEPGQKKAVNYLRDFYINQGIKPPKGVDNYFQTVPSKALNINRYGMKRFSTPLKESENVIAYIEGSEKPEEFIVITAHLDHEGVKGGKIYNGADDDGSGTVAVLEIAEAFKKATEAGKRPKRSVVFLHVTGEEKGLLGSKYYSENPIFPLANTVANLNIDMVGRIDERHKENPNYVYLIGSDKLSTDLHNVSEAMNEKYMNINLDYKYNADDDPNRFYYRSDHYNFAKHGIPVIFYFNGTHEDYHQPTDTPDKINYDLLQNRARLIFYTAWEIANRKDRLVVDGIENR